MHPVLLNGVGSPQDHQEVATTPYHSLGDVAFLGGIMFRYCCSTGAAALTRAELVVAESLVANHQNLATTTGALVVGRNTVTGITLGATALTANQYADGFMHVVDAGGEGTWYRIREHDAGTASDSDFTLVLYDNIVVASDASTEVTLVQNKYKGLEQSNTDQADVPVCIPAVTVPIGSTTPQWFWGVVRGYCGAWVEGTPAVGTPLMQSDATAGMLETRAETDPDRAIAEMVTVGINTEVQVVNLFIE